MTAAAAAETRALRTVSLPSWLIAGVVVTSASSLAALWAWGASPAGRYLEHRVDSAVETTYATALLLFTASWVLMTAATMLPTATPLLRAVHTVVAQRRDATALVWATIGGFSAVWLFVGIAAAFVDVAAHGLIETTGLDRYPHVTAAGGLGLAAAYQLSPMAGRCLRACRSPFGFLGRHWTGRDDVLRQSFAVGASYGWSCLGCCAALMVVMLGVGMGNVGWMLALGAVTAVQKGAGFGHGLSIAVGIVLAGAAVLTAGGWA